MRGASRHDVFRGGVHRWRKRHPGADIPRLAQDPKISWVDDTEVVVGKIVASLRDKGIPSRMSDTAGTFLCNTTLYRALGACERLGTGARCGFVHLPYLPQQVAELLDDLSKEGRLELHQRADLASMSFDMMLDAVGTTLAISLEQG